MRFFQSLAYFNLQFNANPISVIERLWLQNTTKYQLKRIATGLRGHLCSDWLSQPVACRVVCYKSDEPIDFLVLRYWHQSIGCRLKSVHQRSLDIQRERSRDVEAP